MPHTHTHARTHAHTHTPTHTIHVIATRDDDNDHITKLV